MRERKQKEERLREVNLDVNVLSSALLLAENASIAEVASRTPSRFHLTSQAHSDSAQRRSHAHRGFDDLFAELLDKERIRVRPLVSQLLEVRERERERGTRSFGF